MRELCNAFVRRNGPRPYGSQMLQAIESWRGKRVEIPDRCRGRQLFEARVFEDLVFQRRRCRDTSWLKPPCWWLGVGVAAASVWWGILRHGFVDFSRAWPWLRRASGASVQFVLGAQEFDEGFCAPLRGMVP